MNKSQIFLLIHSVTTVSFPFPQALGSPSVSSICFLGHDSHAVSGSPTGLHLLGLEEDKWKFQGFFTFHSIIASFFLQFCLSSSEWFLPPLYGVQSMRCHPIWVSSIATLATFHSDFLVWSSLMSSYTFTHFYNFFVLPRVTLHSFQLCRLFMHLVSQ